jgi:hypothetical protein
MRSRRIFGAASLAFVAAIGLAPAPRAMQGVSTPAAPRAADTLPQRLSDQEFWKLSEDFSEPNGFFRSDNLLSNELGLQYVLADLEARTYKNGVYLGVGPEQNFTYIAALQPKIVFITDIRRGNLHTQLMYKALFELSKDRADFVSRLFTKKRPDGLTDKSSALDIFNAYWDIVSSPEAAYEQNLKDIDDLLTKKHALPLSKDDLDGIEYVYHNFYWFGPSINYNSSSSNGTGRGNMANYADLMTADDGHGLDRAFLGTEANFRVLKDLEERNLMVPVVGNFAGPKALRAVGKYVRDHGAVVTAMYLSNVEQYLNQDGIWNNFCANVATFPLDDHSTFIRSGQGGGFGGRGGGLTNYLGSMKDETRGCGGGHPSPASVRTAR